MPVWSNNVINAWSGPCLTCLACMGVLTLLRWAGMREHGRAALAGTVAGLLMGVSVAGRVMPVTFEEVFDGGMRERHAFEYSRWAAAELPAAMSNVSDEARASQKAMLSTEADRLRAEWNEAHWQHQRATRIIIVLCAGLLLVIGCARRGRPRNGRVDVVTPLSIGLWAFALPAALAYVAATRWWGASSSDAAVVAAAVGIGPWCVNVRQAISGALEATAADEAEVGGARLMDLAGRVATMLAIGVIAWALWMNWRDARMHHALERIALFTPLLLPALAWIILALIGPAGDPVASASGGDAPRDRSGPFMRLLTETLIAMLAASIALRIDVHASLAWSMAGMLMVFGLLADDGRWMGAWIGAMLPGGRRTLRTVRLVMPMMAAGPTQLVVAALALQAWLLPAMFALPLLAGVLLIELTAPLRRDMAARLIVAERAIENDR